MNAATARRICTFRLGSQLFGLDVDAVQEILVAQAVTPVPLAPPAVVGVVNLRGQIVTVVDLRRRLGLPERDPSESPVHVIARTERELLSFLVDRAGDVLPVDEDAFEPPPETLRGPARELILGAYKLESSLLLLLDPERAGASTSEDPREDAVASSTGGGGA